jgi:hypothetical protein
VAGDPAAGIVAGALYQLVDGLGKDIAGPLAVSLLAAVAAGLLFVAAQRSNPVSAQDV